MLRFRALAAMVAVATLIAGCGSGRTSGSLTPTGIAHQISAGLGRQFSVPTPAVTCPADAPTTANSSFTCRGTVAGQALPLTVTVGADGRRVDWHPDRAIVSTAAAVAQIDQKFGAQLGVPVKADCGVTSLLVKAPGMSFTCAVGVNGTPRTVTVRVEDVAGDVHYDLAPPATGPGSTTPPVTAPATPGPAPGGTLPGD